MLKAGVRAGTRNRRAFRLRRADAEHASDFRSAGVRYTTTDQEAEAAITKNADALGL